MVYLTKLKNDFVFDNGIGSMRHESYLVFCIRIQLRYQKAVTLNLLINYFRSGSTNINYNPDTFI